MKHKKNRIEKEYKEILTLTGKYLEQKKEQGERQVYLSKNIKLSQREKSSTIPENLLAKLEKKLKNCRKCNLGKSRTNLVFGAGNPMAWLMFVGEGPGHDEDMKGLPFIGRAGKLLTNIINAMKMKREDVYIANIVKCHPMINPDQPQKRGNDRPPRPEEIVQCKPFLLKQIEIIKPEVICTLGNYSTAFIFEKYGLKDQIQGISKIHGKVFEAKNLFQTIKIIPLYHPAVATYNINMKSILKEDFKILRSI